MPSTARKNEFHPAFEEYCEVIFELAEDDLDVIQARIADRLNVSRPAVSEMIRRLERAELVVVGGSIRLTQAGRDLAEQVVRRHRLAERFLTDVLGLSWSEAHEEAGKWEHVISDGVERALVRFLGEPTTCPHGNPIPGTAYEAPRVVNLSALAAGAEFTVSRIPEELEFAPGILDFLEGHALRPGTSGVVRSWSTNGSALIDVAGELVNVDTFVADRIQVAAGVDA